MDFKFNTLLRAIVSGRGAPSFYLNFSNPSNVTIADGQGRGTITSVRNSVISSSISVSRTSGVAPLYVNFDYTATTSTGSTNAPHECFFATDFGDPGAGTWANGVQSSGLTSKNSGYGPVTGHVYETPGTYNVTMVVTDGVNTSSRTATITVQDPDVVYAGTNTICLSHSGNFTGAPSGSSQPVITGNTDMTALLNTYKASNKRVLFCKADAWIATDQILFDGLTGFTLGGYGTGVAHTFSSGTMVSVTPTSFGGVTGKSLFILSASAATDTRICNIRINSNRTVHCSAINMTMSQMLYYKVEIRGCTQGWNVLASQNPTSVVPDQVCLYECLVDDLYGDAFHDTARGTVTFASGTPGVFTFTGNGDYPARGIVFTGSVPAELTSGTTYYVYAATATANTFSVTTSNVGAGTPIAFAGSGSCTATYNPLAGGVPYYVALTRGGLMGCYADNHNHGEQVTRIPFADRAHVNNNTLKRPNQTKNNFRIHSVIHAYFPVWSEKFVVSGNVISNVGGYDYNGTTTNMGYSSIAHMGSAGNAGVGGEWVRNGIFENNLIESSRGFPKDGLFGVNTGGPNMTVRNNIADFRLGADGAAKAATYTFTNIALALINTDTADQAVGVRVYNNTIYTNISGAEKINVAQVSAPTGGNPQPDQITVKNNILYAPHQSTSFYRQTLYQNAGAAATNVVTTNNTDEVSSITTTPSFVTTPPVALADWKPSGYPVNTGTTVPVLRDFNNASRYGSTYDLGAVLP